MSEQTKTIMGDRGHRSAHATSNPSLPMALIGQEVTEALTPISRQYE